MQTTATLHAAYEAHQAAARQAIATGTGYTVATYAQGLPCMGTGPTMQRAIANWRKCWLWQLGGYGHYRATAMVPMATAACLARYLRETYHSGPTMVVSCPAKPARKYTGKYPLRINGYASTYTKGVYALTTRGGNRYYIGTKALIAQGYTNSLCQVVGLCATTLQGLHTCPHAAYAAQHATM